jgi:cyclophilin family peptidyl-prolyl cis-trans isomerase
VSKAAKRQRKKEGRRQRIEAATKAAERRRRRNLNVALGVIALAVLGFVVFTRLTKPAAKKVVTKGSATATATPSQSAPSPSPAASAAVGSSPTATATASTGAPAALSCTTAKPPSGNHATQSTPPPMTVSASKTYTATILTSCGTIVADLAVKDSPNTVNSFVYLANKGFYNGLTFHRIARDFAVQGGDPQGTGGGTPGYSVQDPVPPGIVYSQGTLAMAKTGTEPAGTSGSQFFIVPTADASRGYQPLYALLGHVTSGLDVVTKINSLPITGGSSDGPPAQPVYINTITIKVH